MSELAQFAASVGWQYIARDDQLAFQWQRPPFNQGYDHRANDVLRGTFVGRQVVAFDYSYKETHHRRQRQHLVDDLPLRRLCAGVARRAALSRSGS